MTLIAYSGNCDCGNSRVTVYLPQTLDKYHPRACDCNFCISRQLSYLSDPDGMLEIESPQPFKLQQQGSNQAVFVTCHGCDTVIAVTFKRANKLKGALNSHLLSDAALLQAAISVSPKQLSASDKVSRWQSLWLATSINGKAKRQ